MSSELLKILVCPVTKQPLVYDRENQELISEGAGLAYPIRDCIPILLVDQARRINNNYLKHIPTRLDYVSSSSVDISSDEDNNSPKVA
ncbi:MAG: Trm112 family protein [Rickettsiaceae bacterium]|nr:Trm112 family protein [Rickettsiaceae bacterium]